MVEQKEGSFYLSKGRASLLTNNSMQENDIGHALLVARWLNEMYSKDERAKQGNGKDMANRIDSAVIENGGLQGKEQEEEETREEPSSSPKEAMSKEKATNNAGNEQVFLVEELHAYVALGNRSILRLITEFAGAKSLVQLSQVSLWLRFLLASSPLYLDKLGGRRRFRVKELVEHFFPRPYEKRYWDIHGVRLDIGNDLAEAIGVVGIGVKTLDLSDCFDLFDLSPLTVCTSLEKLVLKRCKHVNDLSPLSHCKTLRELNLVRCKRITDLSALANNRRLETLNVSRCGRLKELGALPYLQHLNASYCKEISSLRSLMGSISLRSLDLTSNSRITDINPLVRLTKLEVLILSGLDRVTDISCLADCRHLKSLSLNWCDSLTDVSCLQHCRSLRSLHMIECKNEIEISSLALCRKLENLCIYGSNCNTGLNEIEEYSTSKVATVGIEDCSSEHPIPFFD